MSGPDSIQISQLTTTAKTIWAVGTAAVSIATALISTAIYIHDLINQVHELQGKVQTLETRLSVVSTPTGRPVDHWNGRETQKCEPGSFMVGARIGSGLDGEIWCAKVQPTPTK